MNIYKNPLTSTQYEPTADLENIKAPTVIHKKRNVKRDLRDLRRAKTAKDALAGWDVQHSEIFGFTKGAFSIIDIINAVLEITGPASVVFSTWTAAKTDITTVLDMVKSGRITSARWLVDLTFQRRSPELAHAIRQTFGDDSIRVAKNHAKFSLINAKGLKIVIRTSMNINFNPRFEDFTIAHDPELFDFINNIVAEVWSRQPRSMANMNPHAIERHFEFDL